MPKRTNIFLQRVAEANQLTDDAPETEPLYIALDRIDPNPNQARQVFDSRTLDELANSIREHGVMQPIGVRPLGDRYVIIYGERRYRAAGGAGLKEIPATVHEVDEQQANIMTALENLHREDLDIEDEARYFQTLLDATGLSERKLADKLGINHVYINRRVKLLQRPDLLERYRQGLVTLHEAVGADETVSQGNTPPVEQVERDEWDAETMSQRHSDEQEPAARRYYLWRPYRNAVRRLQQTSAADLASAEDKQELRTIVDEMQAEIDRLRAELG